MTSFMRNPLPQLRIIQQQFDRKEKRPYSSGKANTSEEDDDDYEDEPNARFSNSNGSEPPTKIRKKPGRKPNPASPAVRKEQNRAAQRAFRDRKERHLQEMEAMIKELKETNSQMTTRSQQDAQKFKSALESMQSENYYLRQVVFSFETALNKGGNVAILQEVKAELYRRHYEKHTQKKLSGPTSPSRDQRPPAPSTPSVFLPNGNIPSHVAAQGKFRRPYEQILDLTVPSSQTPSSSPSSSSFTKSAIPSTFSTASPSATAPFDDRPTTPSSPSTRASSASSSSSSSTSSSSPSSSVLADKMMDPRDETIFSFNNDILYKEPPLYCMVDPNDSKLIKSITPFEHPLVMPPVTRPFFTETGAYLAKRTEYTKNGSVFDELQSSLFPPGTLQSIIHSELATPQEIVNDISLLDQLHDPHHRPLRDPVIAPGQATIAFCSPALDACLLNASPSFLDDDNGSTIEFEMSTPTLGLDDGLKQNVIPSKRLRLEIQVLASAPPAVDPNIDPKVYALPHDTRIDLIPCPRLRAQMILHQKKFDIEDLCQLLINGARCHGHPLDPHSWELPEEFFDRYGFLLGQEMLRHRNKIWPKKDDLLPETSKAH